MSRLSKYVVCVYSSENIHGVSNTLCSTWSLCVTAGVRFGVTIDCLQNHNNWISTCAAHYLWLVCPGPELPVQKLSAWIAWPHQHHDNPVGADYTSAFGSLLMLTRWRKNVIFWCCCKSTTKEKKGSQQCLELFRPVRWSK